jgi:dihydropteroate synthase
MGVLNVTPDSFSGDGLAFDAAMALDRAQELEAAGADILDVGAESTRPGAEALSDADEWARLRPVLDHLAHRVRVPISVDTYKAEIARRAMDAGALLINDISGLRYEPALAEVVASTEAALVLMHMRGRPHDMYGEAVYRDVVADVADELTWSLKRAIDAQISVHRIILDPGIGFAKRAEHSLAVLAGIERLKAIGLPLLVGPSRKSFLGTLPGGREARDWATAAAVTTAILGGAHIVRVHNVAALLATVQVADAIRATAEA